MSPQAWMYLLYALVFFALVLLVPPLIKRFYYQRMMKDLDEKNFKAFNKHLDSFLAKVNFSAFERESMRLSEYEMKGEAGKADEQIQFMEHMRLSRKQRAQLGERGFYVYLNQGKIKKARHMIELTEEYGSPAQSENLKIQYSILLKKESKYIDAIKERLSKVTEENGQPKPGMQANAGMFEYLLGLQYSYDKDFKTSREWFKKALENLKGTPYEQEIRQHLRG